ncbi:MAG: hypothetical protein CW342_04155 [Thermoactinomycetaceae bacterium]|nr:hypothetical protein [Bacillota bacterium]MBO2532071.1 hypothetical protein [Thermoactinomycetaceae bacterium]
MRSPYEMERMAEKRMKEMEKEILRRTRRGNSPLFGGKALALLLGASGAENEKERRRPPLFLT